MPTDDATQPSQPPPAGRRSRTLTLARGVAGMLLLLVGLLAAALLFLQGETGQDWLARSLTQWLSGPQGQVTVQHLRGRLPWDLQLGRLTWADREGPWLEVEQLQFSWAMAGWWRGEVSIQTAGAERVRLLRQPRPDPAAAVDSSALTVWPLLAWLPSLRVDRLHIAQLTLEATAYGQAARFALEGEIRHIATPTPATSQTPPEPTQLLASLRLHPLDAGDTQLDLQARLSPAGPVRGDSRLTLTLHGQEHRGVMTALTGLPQVQGLDVRLTGQGPLSAWQGQLEATLHGAGGVRGQVDFHHASPSTLRFAGQVQGEATLFDPDWRALLVPVDSAPARQTAAVGPRAALDLLVETAWLEDGQLAVRQLTVGAPAGRLQGQGTWALATRQLNGTLQLELPRLAVAAPLTGLPLRHGNLTATLTAQGHWRTPRLQLTAQVAEPGLAGWRARQLVARWEGNMAEQGDELWHGQGQLAGLRPGDDPEWGAQPLTWSARLTRSATGPVRLTRLSVTDETTTALVQGDVELVRPAGQGQWQMTTARLADWVGRLAPAHAPLDGQGQWSGRFSLTRPTGPTAPMPHVTATLTGALSALQGLPAALQTLLGSEVKTAATLAWSMGQPLVLSGLQLQGSGAQGEGGLQVEPDGQRLTGQFQVHLPQLAPLSALAGVALKGEVWGDLQLDGPPEGPRLQAALRTPALEVGRAHWEDARAHLVVDAVTAPPRGTLKVTWPGLDKQPFMATGAYRLEGALLHLTDLRLPWPGGEMTGERVQVDLARLVVDGRLQGRSSAPGAWAQWLAGPVNPLPAGLEGSVAVQLQWAGQGQQQNLEATLDGQLLRGGFGLLDRSTLKVRLADLWGEVNGGLEGSVSKLQWGNTQVRDAQWTVAGTRRAVKVTLGGRGLLALGDLPGLQAAQSTVVRTRAGQPPQTGFDWEANGTLGMDDKGVIRGTLAGLTGHIGPDAVQLGEAVPVVLTPDARSRGGSRLDLGRLVLHYGAARLHLQGHYDAQRVEMDGELRLPLGLLARLGGPDLQGSAQAHLKISGSPSQPDGQLSLQVEKLHINDPVMEAIPPATMQADARLEKGQVKLNLALQELTSSPVTAMLLFPVQLGFAPARLAVPAGGPVEGTLNADAQLAQFMLMVAPGWMDSQKLDGLLKLALRFGGTVAAPEVQGEILVENGSYENGALGTVLKGIRLQAMAQGRTITINTLEANDGGQGRLRATGQLSLDLAQRLPFQLNATLEKGTLVRQDEWQAILSGPLVVQGNRDRVEITGSLTGNELLLYLADTTSLDVQTVPIDMEIRHGVRRVVKKEGVAAAPTPVFLDVALHLPGRVFLRGRGLESEWHGDLAIRGRVGEPRIDGQILVRRGYFEFLDQRFELRKGIIAFDGTTPPQPNLDLEAESKPINNMVAVLSLEGPAFTPVLKLSSDPELPQDELLSRLLFNRNRQQLSPAQAINLAVAVEKLRSGGPGLLGRARDSLGIDRLELGGDSVDAGSLKAGKYLGDKVLLGVERGVKQGSGKVSVELEMLPNVILQTEMDETNKSGVGVNWKYDY
ncbi:MAG: translocation/assembly module TamB domain-containing protein [Magnetococcus sp. DMHC-8]